MGISQPSVAAFERYDSNPTLATIRRYALAVEARLQTKVVDDCVDEARAGILERFVTQSIPDAKWVRPNVDTVWKWNNPTVTVIADFTDFAADV